MPARRSAFLAVLAAALGGAAPASATTLTEFPTCSLPLSADQALCEDGRSPNRLVAGPDGGVWFTTFGGGEIGRISPAGAMTLYDTPTKPGTPATAVKGPLGITVGPDGALWFVEDFANRIGRVTPAGAFSFVDDPGARPQGIALGADGNLWITESGTNSIGRLTPAGALAHVALAPVKGIGNKLSEITPGPDGRLWFAEQVGGAIGAITTGGVVTEYALPKGSSPQDVAAGPDGKLWFTDFAKDRVGRMTTGGTFDLTTFPGAGPASIAPGPDGALWAGESKASGLLRIAPAGGKLSETPLLSGAVVNDVTTGPDGAIWFVETAHNRIGRLELDAATGLGPVVTSVTPGGGAAGATVTVRGENLDGATQVLFGATPLTPSGPVAATRLEVTAPHGAVGPVPVRVVARGRTSPASGASVFAFTGDPALLAAPVPVVAAPSFASPGRPVVQGSTVKVPLTAGAAGTYTLTLAIGAADARTGAAAASGRRPAQTLASSRGRATRAGARTVRLTLSATARRALARARAAKRPVYVAARLTGADKRVTVRQRGGRLR